MLVFGVFYLCSRLVGWAFAFVCSIVPAGLRRRIASLTPFKAFDPAARPTLVTIPFSHYCEKARWALQVSGGADKAFVEMGVSPILHFPTTFYLSGGRSSSTPMYVTPQKKVLTESSDILEHLHLQGETWLFPTEEVRQLVAYLDKELGPHSRRVVYYHVFNDSRQIVKALFGKNVSRVAAVLSQLLFPATRIVMRQGLSINEAGKNRSVEKVAQVFGRVNELLKDGRRFLCNTDRPSAADITFAALAYPLLAPPQMSGLVYSYCKAVLPEDLMAYMEKLRATPAGKFGLRMYEEHRGAAVVQFQG